MKRHGFKYALRNGNHTCIDENKTDYSCNNARGKQGFLKNGTYLRRRTPTKSNTDINPVIKNGAVVVLNSNITFSFHYCELIKRNNFSLYL